MNRAVYFFSLFVLLGLNLSFAQSPIELQLQRHVVTQELKDGEQIETLTQALELEPGALIEESLFAKNVSDAALNRVGLVVPVPEGTMYIAGSAAPITVAKTQALPEFSTDGETFALPPLMTTVVSEDGTETRVEVLPEAYTHVRWVIPEFEAQAEVTVRFRAEVR